MIDSRSLTVRRARPDDLDAIDAIERLSFSADRFPRRNLARLLRSPSAAFLVAEEQGRDLGYVLLLFRKGAKAARLYSLATAPAARGRGIASELVQAARRYAMKMGSETLRLELRASNAGARRLYEREGFTIRKRSPGYYDDGETALHMELRLTRPETSPAAGKGKSE